MNKFEEYWMEAQGLLEELGYKMDSVGFKLVKKLEGGDLASYNQTSNTVKYTRKVLKNPHLKAIVFHEACHKAERVLNDYEYTLEYKQTRGHTKSFKKIVKALREASGVMDIPLDKAPIDWMESLVTEKDTVTIPVEIEKALKSFNKKAVVKFEEIKAYCFPENKMTNTDNINKTIYFCKEDLELEGADLVESIGLPYLDIMLAPQTSMELMDYVDELIEILYPGYLEECVTSAEFAKAAPAKKMNLIFLGKDSKDK